MVWAWDGNEKKNMVVNEIEMRGWKTLYKHSMEIRIISVKNLRSKCYGIVLGDVTLYPGKPDKRADASIIN